MDRTFRFILTLLPIVFTVAFASRLMAYPTPVDFDGSVSRWNIEIGDDPITYELKADTEEEILIYGSTLDDSAALWSNVPTSFFTFMPVPEGETAKVTVHLQNNLEGGDYSAGYALFDQVDENGPKHCDIFVAVGSGTAFVSVGKTLLHELGHCLGLGHSVIPQAIMSYQLSENAFALDVDDEAAVSRLYPADGSKPHLPPGCAAGSALPRSNLSSLVLLALLMIAPLGLSLFSLSQASGRWRRAPFQ